MNINKLLNCHVHIVGDDPFENRVPAVVRLVEQGHSCILLEFTPGLLVGGEIFAYAVAEPRGHGQEIQSILTNGYLSCALTCIPLNRFDRATPFDLSWWRGGAAGTADVVLYDVTK